MWLFSVASPVSSLPLGRAYLPSVSCLCPYPSCPCLPSYLSFCLCPAPILRPPVVIRADSGHRDQPFRSIVITDSGDADHSSERSDVFSSFILRVQVAEILPLFGICQEG